MKKENNKDWELNHMDDFEPYSNEEFVKNIERAFLMEEEDAVEMLDEGEGKILVISGIEGAESDKVEKVSNGEYSEEISKEEAELVNDESKKIKFYEAEEIKFYEAEEIEVGEAEEIEVGEAEDDTGMKQLERAIHSIVNQELLHETEYIKSSKEDGEDEIVLNITNSLAKQEEVYVEGMPPNSETEQNPKKKKLWVRIMIPSMSVLFTLFLLFLFICYTTPGRNFAIKIGAMFAAGRTNYEDGSNQVEAIIEDEVEEFEVIKELNELQEEEVNLNANEGTARREAYAVNILLLGEETIDSGTSRGRTDVMLILTMNKREKTIKLTSLMRDLYVQIPGHLDNKLNSAYATGGIPLLYDTIELNFDLKLDGYILVDFNDFEKIIDLLDGVDISLTRTEANYLNTTNYISNPNYRNVVAGMNHMNGNQALGYCRIRKVGTAEQVYNDFGRTTRHRILLDAIFNRYKSLGLWDLAMVANSCLPMVTTDLDASEIEEYLKIALDIGPSKLDQFRIPVDGTFEDATIRKMSVIVPNLQKNVTALHEFIFGVEE